MRARSPLHSSSTASKASNASKANTATSQGPPSADITEDPVNVATETTSPEVVCDDVRGEYSGAYDGGDEGEEEKEGHRRPPPRAGKSTPGSAGRFMLTGKKRTSSSQKYLVHADANSAAASRPKFLGEERPHSGGIKRGEGTGKAKKGIRRGEGRKLKDTEEVAEKSEPAKTKRIVRGATREGF